MKLTTELRAVFISQTKNCYLDIQSFIENRDFSYDSVTEMYKQYIELCLSIKKIDEYNHINIINTNKIPSKFASLFSATVYTEKDDAISKILLFRFQGSFISNLYNNKVSNLFEEALSNLDTIFRLL